MVRAGKKRLNCGQREKPNERDVAGVRGTQLFTAREVNNSTLVKQRKFSSNQRSKAERWRNKTTTLKNLVKTSNKLVARLNLPHPSSSKSWLLTKLSRRGKAWKAKTSCRRLCYSQQQTTVAAIFSQQYSIESQGGEEEEEVFLPATVLWLAQLSGLFTAKIIFIKTV